MDNTRNNNPISDKDILKNIAKAVNRSITMLAEDLDEKPGTLYQITTGRNNISARVKASIIETYPTINPDYIENGIGDIIIKNIGQKDEAFTEEVFMQLARLNKKMELMSDKLSSLIALSKK